MDDPQVVVPVDPREITELVTKHGDIHIIHEITLGDLLISTLLLSLIIMLLISRVMGGRGNV